MTKEPEPAALTVTRIGRPEPGYMNSGSGVCHTLAVGIFRRAARAEADTAAAPEPAAAPSAPRSGLVIPAYGAASGRPESLPTAFACISLIVHVAAQARVTVERGGVTVPAPEWLRRPDTLNGGTRPRALMAAAVTDLAARGRAGWYATPLGSVSWSLVPIPAYRLRCRFDANGARVWSVDGVDVPLADGPGRRAGVLPVGYLFLDDRAEPLGPLQAAAYLIDGYLDTEHYARNVFRSGEVSGARLETDADIPEPTAQRWRDAWIEAHSDPMNPRIPVLGAGLRYVTDLIDPTAAAWIEARQVNAQEVARLFRVPGRRVGLPSGDSVTYATARDDDLAFMRGTVAGYTDPIAEAWSSLLPFGRNATEEDSVVFDWGRLLVMAPEERAAYLLSLHTAGVITTEEVRDALGYDPSVVVEAQAITQAAAQEVPS